MRIWVHAPSQSNPLSSCHVLVLEKSIQTVKHYKQSKYTNQHASIKKLTYLPATRSTVGRSRRNGGSWWRLPFPISTSDSVHVWIPAKEHEIKHPKVLLDHRPTTATFATFFWTYLFHSFGVVQKDFFFLFLFLFLHPSKQFRVKSNSFCIGQLHVFVAGHVPFQRFVF